MLYKQLANISLERFEIEVVSYCVSRSKPSRVLDHAVVLVLPLPTEAVMHERGHIIHTQAS
jgi:hypothetical protein